LRALLAYPVFLLCFGGIVLVFLVVLVVPTFDKMFLEFGLRLPAPTKFLIWISRQLTSHLPRTLIALVAAVSLGFISVRLWLRYALSTRLLGMFTSGNSANVTAMARFTGSLAELLSIDAPLPDALKIAGLACKHPHFRVAADRLARELAIPGASLLSSPCAHNFPATMRHALGDGRSGKPNIPLLRELSRMYSERARTRINWSTSILGPVSLIGLGILVGFVVIALFMPLVSLVTSLS
jgi:type IV pilus assembly protein PilC